MKRKLITGLFSVMLATNLLTAADKEPAALAPFGAGLKVPAKNEIKEVSAKIQPVDCLIPPNSSRWEVELPPADQTGKLFSIEEKDGKNILNIAAGELAPKKTTIRILLPGDSKSNGDIWSKNKASYISFLAKSNKPAQMTFHLLQRGKTAGTYQAGFNIKPGDWQKIILPIEEFKLRSFAKIAGLGIRTADAEKGTTISITDIMVGGIPYSDASWKNHRLDISLLGDWYFKTDADELGIKEKWFADKFDSSSWQVLQSGQPWEQQGIQHYGWGWYRQQIFVPKEFAGTALTISLTKIPSDDEVWFNGTRIGGISGEYKYNNWIDRSYTVPASLIRYGENNSIAIRIWGGDITFIGNKSGLNKGPLVAELDPYRVMVRKPGSQSVPIELFDFSDARYGKPFEIVFPFPAELVKQPGAALSYRLTDLAGNEITSGKESLTAGTKGIIQAVIKIGPATAQTIYLRGGFRAAVTVEDDKGSPLYCGTREFNKLSFAQRDETPLPSLPEKFEDTPYGKLKLVDEIDCATQLADDPHPYFQGGFDHAYDRLTPGPPVDVQVKEILGKKARESEYGWFAYRVGRGKLIPHNTYLLRIEYPEDKPRFCPIEIQTGQNYMDVGWKNGIEPDDVYDNWPISKQWQWYDVIVPLDDQTAGTGGTGSASAENGFWVYFMNKMKPGFYYSMWSGGPAVARMKLYEIDPEKNPPVINKPKDLPSRVLSFDWERQPDHNPADLIKYAKLMGYNAISPLIIKWHFANYSDPLNGYSTMLIDDRDYWSHLDYDPAAGKDAASPYPGKKSQHVRYLEATKKYGIDYIPRFEWGGSMDLPKEAWAIDTNGNPTKPNRFSKWCGNLLHPATWDDLKKLMDHLVKPYVKDNPQLTGVLWRIRCNRMPISYGVEDIKLFSKETNTPLPGGAYEQWAAWATGAMKEKYDDWWHKKRADFHVRLAKLLQSYRPDLVLYYYNWDPDKFGIIEPDITAWAFVKNLLKPAPHGGKAAYVEERQLRKSFTAKDYTYVMHTGNFGKAFGGVNRADMGIRPELYKNDRGIQIFAPVSYLCYADKQEYLNYFQTADGLAMSNCVSYDEIGSRSINPKYEGNMLTPGGGPFSMALELLGYFYGDARTLNYTVYTYGRGFADAHRRFAQAFLALPAIPGKVIENKNPDVKIRIYASTNGTYVGVAYKGYQAAKLAVAIPGTWTGKEQVIDLVTNKTITPDINNGTLNFNLDSGPMELNSYIIK